MAETSHTTDHVRRATQLSRVVVDAEAEYSRVAQAEDKPGGGSTAGDRRLKALGRRGERALMQLARTPAACLEAQQAKARALRASLFPSAHAPVFDGAAAHLALSLIYDLLGEPLPTRTENRLLTTLRPLACEAGVGWLKNVQATYGVETLSELPDPILTLLIAGLRQSERQASSTRG